MNNHMDEGGGITDISIALFKNIQGDLGELVHMWLARNNNYNAPLYSCEITGMEGNCLLSGCNCGYGGTGPHGSIRLLEMIIEANKNKPGELAMDSLRERILSEEDIFIQFPQGWSW